MDPGKWRRRALVAVLVPLAGCDPSKTDAVYWQRGDAPANADGGGSNGDAPGDRGDQRGGSPGDPSAPDAPSAEPDDPSTGEPTAKGSIRISVTTVSYRGEYAPENVGAIWIAGEDGALVRTLETWGSKRFKNAVAYRAVARPDEVDVVSGATRKSSGAHTVTWDLRDHRGTPVEDGVFLLNVEFTEDDSADKKPAGPHLVVPFSTTLEDGATTAPDEASFRGITIAREP